MTHNEQDVETVARAIRSADHDGCEDGWHHEVYLAKAALSAMQNQLMGRQLDKSGESACGYHGHTDDHRLPAQPCPHVHTGKDGTSHCTLAESTGRRMNDIEQAAKGLREAASWGLAAQKELKSLYDFREWNASQIEQSIAATDKALAQYDALVKGE